MSLWDPVYFTGLSMTGNLVNLNTNDAFSLINAPNILSGGLVVAKNLYVGGDTFLLGNVTVTGTVNLPALTYTPTITKTGGGGTLNAVTYTTQQASYQVVDKVVTLSVNCAGSYNISNPQINIGLVLPVMPGFSNGIFTVKTLNSVQYLSLDGTINATLVGTNLAALTFGSGNFLIQGTFTYFK